MEVDDLFSATLDSRKLKTKQLIDESRTLLKMVIKPFYDYHLPTTYKRPALLHLVTDSRRGRQNENVMLSLSTQMNQTLNRRLPAYPFDIRLASNMRKLCLTVDLRENGSVDDPCFLQNLLFVTSFMVYYFQSLDCKTEISDLLAEHFADVYAENVIRPVVDIFLEKGSSSSSSSHSFISSSK